MNITKTTNTSLALSVSVVPSYISRLRNGQRTLPKNSDLIAPISVYFAEKIADDPQKQQLLHACGCPETVPDNVEKTAKILSRWLMHNTDKSSVIPHALSTGKTSGNLHSHSAAIYYGISGKQEAVIRFLSEILENPKPQTLLLFSDENMEWLMDPAFFSTWRGLLMRILLQKNHIKIIHNINRGSREIEAAIHGWVPLYTTNLIDPYYCPVTKKDGILRRTLFIAPETAVISSFSIQENIENTPNLYITDPQAIQAFTKEFEDYAGICKPLMQKYSFGKNSEYLDILEKWEQNAGTLHLMPEYLSALSLPLSLLEAHCISPDLRDVLPAVQNRHTRQIRQLDLCDVYDLIVLPDPEDVTAGKVRIPLFPYPAMPELTYTAEEFRAHLREIIHLLQTQETYHVVIRFSVEPYVVNVKDASGVFVISRDTAAYSYFFNEPHMTAGFRNELKQKIQQNTQSRTEIITQLEEYLSRLSSSI